MNPSSLSSESTTHFGLVLDVSPNRFDSGSAGFGSIFTDEDSPNQLFLFYSGATNGKMQGAAIGLASSGNGIQFKKESREPILEGIPNSFCASQAVAPAVIRIRNRFYMILSGKPSAHSARRIGLACADDPKGPWHIMGELIKPTYLWEGNNIDNGLSIVKTDVETILLYYSNITSPKAYDVGAFIRRYAIRRIGILKVRIKGTSLSNVEAMRFSGNPLRHLNGLKGNWNESVFSPSYIKLDGKDYLFPSAAIYSAGYPSKQYIGMVSGNSPYFEKSSSRMTKLIDGPADKDKIIPGTKNEIFLDTPSPYFNADKHKLHLYYSVADQTNETWKIALTTFNL